MDKQISVIVRSSFCSLRYMYKARYCHTKETCQMTLHAFITTLILLLLPILGKPESGWLSFNRLVNYICTIGDYRTITAVGLFYFNIFFLTFFNFFFKCHFMWKCANKDIIIIAAELVYHNALLYPSLTNNSRNSKKSRTLQPGLLRILGNMIILSQCLFKLHRLTVKNNKLCSNCTFNL